MILLQTMFSCLLIFKQLGAVFLNVVLISSVVEYKYVISDWNQPNIMNIYSALWIAMF